MRRKTKKSTQGKEIDKLNHFLKLEYLEGMIKEQRILFMDPQNWPDKNDVEVLMEYKKRQKVVGLFAFCCLSGSETVHHWSAFSKGGIGCCIEFRKGALISHLAGIDEIRQDAVEYKMIDAIEKGSVPTDRYPFTKRWPYSCESEYRFIWEGDHKGKNISIPINLGIIRKITIMSQDVGSEKYSKIHSKIKKMLNSDDIELNQSGIYRSPDWINKFV